nr:MAG TPA: hypothetical protein [Caudoviricetes sp.]
MLKALRKMTRTLPINRGSRPTLLVGLCKKRGASEMRLPGLTVACQDRL